MSIAGGLYKAIERGESIGCTAIQIFTKSNRQWKSNTITPHDANLFRQAWKNSSIQQVIVHASYLINLGSSNPLTLEKSRAALIDELKRCETLGIPYLVLHPGSSKDLHETKCLDQIGIGLNYALQNTSFTTILLETMAGQGSSVCHSFEHIAYILNSSEFKSRLGVCLDTCHIFAAGYDIRTMNVYTSTWSLFDKTVGLKNLKAIHINDSKKALGSRIDRHEHVGKGKLGIAAFEMLFNDERFFDIPKILETPKASLDDDAKNMALIKETISEQSRISIDIKSKQ